MFVSFLSVLVSDFSVLVSFLSVLVSDLSVFVSFLSVLVSDFSVLVSFLSVLVSVFFSHFAVNVIFFVTGVAKSYLVLPLYQPINIWSPFVGVSGSCTNP